MAQQPARIYHFSGFSVDAARRLLFGRDGLPRLLTPKSFDMLLYLVKRPGKIIDKDELMRAVWPDAAVNENNLNQIISALRRVLGETRADHRYIMTVPRRGYCFVAEVETGAMDGEVPGAASLESIAVLPFKPMTAELRDAALELGMADTLITRLSGGAVIVRPISSVRKYVELEQDSVAAGIELGVEAILEGSIQRWGDDVRATVRLVVVSTGASLWADSFDEKFKDIFTLQDAIARRVSDALALRLSGDAGRRPMNGGAGSAPGERRRAARRADVQAGGVKNRRREDKRGLRRRRGD